MAEPSCSELSLAVGEPLAGTAVANIERWLVIEHAGAWGPKGVEDSGLPAQLLAYLRALGALHPRLRVQLVRRPEREPATRVFFANSGEAAASLHALALDSLDALPSPALDAWLRDESAAPGELCQEPLLLVCGHGRRDRCCARLGLPVYRALSARAPEQTYLTTHLGGHRFAATLLWLPHGLCYGRVAPEEVEALLSASARGEIYDLARVRGRTCYSSEVQAAELALRARLGERRLDALSLRACEQTGAASFRVRFAERGSGREHEIEVQREPLPAAPQSCGATPKPGQRLVPVPRVGRNGAAAGDPPGRS